MKQISIYSLFFLTLYGAASYADNSVTPTVVFRSQSRDKVRQMVGVVGGTERTNHTHRYSLDTWYGMSSIMVEYTQSFHPNRIAHCLFGDDLITGTTACTSFCPTTTCRRPCSPCSSSSSSCNSSCGESIFIQGSRVANRNPHAWLADYFYLPSDFKGSISFKPRIRNVIIDLDFYWGMDEWVNGMYFRLYGPITHTRWDLNFCECIENAGTNSYPQGYFAPSCMRNAELLKSFSSYVGGNTINSCDGIVFQPLQFAKMVACERTKTGFAELRGEFGWDFLSNYDYHLGVNIQGAAPIGNKRRAEFVFSPVVGNGHHWELGGGLTGHYVFCRSQDELKSFSFHWDINVTHLFKGEEQRTFDLKGKPNSRYMLAAKYTQNITNFLNVSNTPGAAINSIIPFYQFANEYTPVANLTTLNVKTSIGIQTDIVALFNVSISGFSWDFGYNFWHRNCEKIRCPSRCTTCDCTNSLCDPSQANTWGLKGDARMFGFTSVDLSGFGALGIDVPIALSATENNATIHTGTNIPSNLDKSSNDPYERNFGVDNPQFANSLGVFVTAQLNFAPFLPVPDNIDNQIKTSLPSLLLACEDIDLCETTRGMSHKVFTHLNYTFNREGVKPFIGIGGFAEFGKTNHNSSSSCPNPCSSSSSQCSDAICLNCALSQWGVWFKGGIAFD